MHRMEYCFRWVWEAGAASLVFIHSYFRPHVLVASIHGDFGVCRGPQALEPRVGDDKTYITTMGMQQKSAHGRTSVATTISMVLLPCAASSMWTWVNQLLPLFNGLDDTGPPPTCTSMSGICYGIAKQY